MSIAKKKYSGFGLILSLLLIGVVEYNIINLLTTPIHLFFLEGTFPSALKSTIVQPVSKKDNVHNISIYRRNKYFTFCVFKNISSPDSYYF